MLPLEALRLEFFLAASTFWWLQAFFGCDYKNQLLPLFSNGLLLCESLCLFFCLLYRLLLLDLETTWTIQIDLNPI
jgi:hypothetical protein